MRQDRELDAIYSRVDRMFCDGKFEDVNLMLELLKPAEMPTFVIMAYLITSNWRKDQLPSRPNFFDRCEKELKTRFDSGFVNKGLSGLK